MHTAAIAIISPAAEYIIHACTAASFAAISSAVRTLPNSSLRVIVPTVSPFLADAMSDT